METKKLPKEIYKILVWKLKEYKYMQEEILDMETEAFKTNKDFNSGIRSKYKKNDSIVNAIAKLNDNQRYLEMKAWQKVISELLEMYINDPAKLKFIQRRYINCALVHFKHKGVLKDSDVIKDLETDGYVYSEITWKRWKAEIIYNLYELVIKEKNLKKIINFTQ